MTRDEALAVVKGFCIREVSPVDLEVCLYGDGNDVLQPMLSDRGQAWPYPVVDSPYDDLLEVDIQREPERARAILRAFMETLVGRGAQSRGTIRRFRSLAIEQVMPSPSTDQIGAIEALLGVALPASFKEFLNVANGAYLEYVIDIPGASGSIEKFKFCGIFSTEQGTYGDETFVGETRSQREIARIPVAVLPFARDGGGSIVYLDLTPKGAGRIIAYIHGLPPWAGARQESALVELAPSFDSYIERLQVDREALLDHLEHDIASDGDLTAMQTFLDAALPRWRDDATLSAAMSPTEERARGAGGAADEPPA